MQRILAEEGPEPTWPIVLALIEKASENAMAVVGAGILEDLLGAHGSEVIERVEAQAGADPRFRFCLSHSWKGEMLDEIWERVVVARGDEPQRG